MDFVLEVESCLRRKKTATGELFAAIAFCFALDCFDDEFGCLKFSDAAVVGWEGSGAADDAGAVDGGGLAGVAVAVVVGARVGRLGGRAGCDV